MTCSVNKDAGKRDATSTINDVLNKLISTRVTSPSSSPSRRDFHGEGKGSMAAANIRNTKLPTQDLAISKWPDAVIITVLVCFTWRPKKDNIQTVAFAVK